MITRAELRHRRLLLGLKQIELAAMWGISLRTYQCLEWGEVQVKPIHFLALEAIERRISAAGLPRIDGDGYYTPVGTDGG